MILSLIANRKFEYYEFLPYIWSTGLIIINHYLSYKYFFSVAKSLDFNATHAVLEERASIICECNTRITLFITLLTSGLSTLFITISNDKIYVGVFCLVFFFFVLYIFNLLQSSNFDKKYFSEVANKEVFYFFIFHDLPWPPFFG